MNINELRDYRCWIGQSAEKVYFAGRAAGGWAGVFPSSLPRWASKVRNYFNVLPTTLKRLPEANAKHLLNRSSNLGFLVECHEVQRANRTFQDYKPKPWGYDPPPFKVPAGCPTTARHDIKHMGFREATALKNSLSGDVYLDDRNRVWYQMAAGSTIYHWGDHPESPTLEAVYQDVIKGQNDTPVFKLVSPDDTGGSHEVIIFNAVIKDGSYNNRGTAIGRANEKWNVRNATEKDPELQGSYNYSETTRVGLAAHEMRDVKTHVKGRHFYVNPEDPYSMLDARAFPPNDLEGKPLADQK